MCVANAIIISFDKNKIKNAVRFKIPTTRILNIIEMNNVFQFIIDLFIIIYSVLPELHNVKKFTQSKNSKQILPQEKCVNRDKFGARTL